MRAIKLFFCLVLIYQAKSYSQEWVISQTLDFIAPVDYAQLTRPYQYDNFWRFGPAPSDYHQFCSSGCNNNCSSNCNDCGLTFPCNGTWIPNRTLPPYGGGTPDKVGATLWDDANHVSTNYYYSASHPSCLKLTATKEDNYYCECSANCNSSNSCFTQPFHYKTGLIESIQHDFTYPLKIEIYCKLPHDKGFNPAFWIWGEDANGMCCSEIDVFELFIKEPSTTVDRVKELDFNFHHYQNPKLSSGTKYYSDIDLSDNFHTYAVEWSYDNIKWLVDGDVRRIVSRTAGTLALWPDAYPGNPQPNPTQLRMVVNLGVNPDCGDCSDDCNGVACDGWTPCGDSNEPDCNAQFPQSFYVDWVKIYSQTQCKSFAICNDDDESSQHTTNVEGYNIDLAVSKDVDYDQHNEDDWCCAGQDFPVTGGPNYQNDLTCALNVIGNYDVKAENIITMHEGFLADANSFANSTDLFVAHIDPCNAHRLTANGNSNNNNNLNTTHANASVFQEKVAVYPNPGTGVFTMDLKDGKGYYLCAAYNCLGKTVQIVKLSEEKSVYVLDLSKQTKGVYFLKFYNYQSIEIKKIIIE